MAHWCETITADCQEQSSAQPERVVHVLLQKAKVHPRHQKRYVFCRRVTHIYSSQIVYQRQEVKSAKHLIFVSLKGGQRFQIVYGEV